MAKIRTPIPALKLNDGNTIPMLAYGSGTAWMQSSSNDPKVDRALVDAVVTALKLEYPHLDCAEYYKTETEVGQAIKESKVDRSKLFVTTKASMDLIDIPGSLQASLKKLQLDYVDLYLIHAPFTLEGEEALQKAWAAMEQVKQQGLAKSIGVSNYAPVHLEATLKTARIPPACNQIEFHPYLQSEAIIAANKAHGIATVAYAPLTPVTKGAPGPLDGLLEQLAHKYAVNPAEILLRWCIEQDVVPITTSSKEQRLSDYLRAMTVRLTPREVEMISAAGKEKHYRGFWSGKFEALGL